MWVFCAYVHRSVIVCVCVRVWILISLRKCVKGQVCLHGHASKRLCMCVCVCFRLVMRVYITVCVCVCVLCLCACVCVCTLVCMCLSLLSTVKTQRRKLGPSGHSQ